MVPVPLGAVKETLTAVELDTVAVPIVGALDFVVTDVDELDETEVPPELVAVTENVYDVFGVNPDTIGIIFIPVKEIDVSIELLLNKNDKGYVLWVVIMVENEYKIHPSLREKLVDTDDPFNDAVICCDTS